ncbi:hypothetical protein Q1695_004270 [Nippostrongylus brasiliensis]|nr:hypothetical protein Q1695_004270 [Nippostrongylus brasiliensis]
MPSCSTNALVLLAVLWPGLVYCLRCYRGIWTHYTIANVPPDHHCGFILGAPCAFKDEIRLVVYQNKMGSKPVRCHYSSKRRFTFCKCNAFDLCNGNSSYIDRLIMMSPVIEKGMRMTEWHCLSPYFKHKKPKVLDPSKAYKVKKKKRLPPHMQAARDAIRRAEKEEGDKDLIIFIILCTVAVILAIVLIVTFICCIVVTSNHNKRKRGRRGAGGGGTPSKRGKAGKKSKKGKASKKSTRSTSSKKSLASGKSSGKTAKKGKKAKKSKASKKGNRSASLKRI